MRSRSRCSNRRDVDFLWEAEEREWDPDRVRQMRETTKQYELFADNTWRETFKVIDKLPYSFSYKFEDAEGRQSTLQVLDWEARRPLLELPAFGRG